MIPVSQGETDELGGIAPQRGIGAAFGCVFEEAEHFPITAAGEPRVEGLAPGFQRERERSILPKVDNQTGVLLGGRVIQIEHHVIARTGVVLGVGAFPPVLGEARRGQHDGGNDELAGPDAGLPLRAAVCIEEELIPSAAQKRVTGEQGAEEPPAVRFSTGTGESWRRSSSVVLSALWMSDVSFGS